MPDNVDPVLIYQLWFDGSVSTQITVKMPCDYTAQMSRWSN